jgi:hypothetical protein
MNSKKLKETFLRTFGSLALLGILAAGLRPANAAQLQVNTNAPHLCAVVQGAATANNTPIIAYSCSGGPEDKWNYIDGQLQGIGTANGKAMCMDVKGQGLTPGTLVDLFNCNGQQNQEWEFYGGQIQSVQSGLCLDSNGGPSTGGGKQLIVNTCSTASSQNWIVRGMQFQLNANAPYNCVADNAGDTANGTPVLSYNCAESPQQIWNYSGSQIQGIGTNNGKSTCLTAGGLTIGSLVTLSSCESLNTQGWEILGYTSLYNEVVLSLVGLCLDSSGGPSVGGGTQLVVNNCTGAASQNWNMR